MTRTTAETARWRDILAFVVIAFGLAWLVTLPLWLGQGLAEPFALVLLVVMMFTPAAAALLVVLVIGRGADPVRRLGIRPFRPARRTLLLCVLGLIGSILLIVAGVGVSAALGLVRLDLVDFSGFAELLAAGGAQPEALPPIGLLVLLQVFALPIGGIVNGFAAVGEELGWRGYLLPALRTRMGTAPALILSGAIWGLWHAPVILLGYNFGRTDLVGVLLMTGACVLLGILFGWLTIASGNLWPAVFAHGGLNAAGGLLALLVAAGEQPDPVVAGPLGLVSWGVMGVVIAAVLAAALAVPRLRRAVSRPGEPAAQG